MPSATLAPEVRRKPEFKLPKLPWPLTANSGDLEVVRWFYESTSDRNGGHWIYVVHFFTGGAERDILLCLRGKRFREDYISKRRSFPFFLNIDLDLRVNRKLKSPPEKVLADFRSLAQRIWDRAQYDHRRHKVARERALRYLGEI